MQQRRGKQAISQLISLLKDTDYIVRGSAALALGKLEAIQAIPQLLLTLNDLNLEKKPRFLYPSSLDKLRSKDPVGADKKSQNIEKRKVVNVGWGISSFDVIEISRARDYMYGSTARALGALGANQAIPSLTRLLQHGNPQAQISAAYALGRLDINQLVSHLETQDSEILIAVVHTLGELGAKNLDSKLTPLLNSEHYSIKNSAIQALGKQPEISIINFAVLLSLLESNSESIRNETIYTLGELEKHSSISRLISLLFHHNYRTQIASITAIGKLASSKQSINRPESQEIKSNLLPLLEHQSYVVQLSTLLALEKITEPKQLSASSISTARLKLFSETLLLGSLAVIALAFLISSIRLNNPYPISWSGHLILPEEIIAELITLHRSRLRQKQPLWRIRLELTYEVVWLIWAVHILTRLQNLWLPNNRINR